MLNHNISMVVYQTLRNNAHRAHEVNNYKYNDIINIMTKKCSIIIYQWLCTRRCATTRTGRTRRPSAWPTSATTRCWLSRLNWIESFFTISIRMWHGQHPRQQGAGKADGIEWNLFRFSRFSKRFSRFRYGWWMANLRDNKVRGKHLGFVSILVIWGLTRASVHIGDARVRKEKYSHVQCWNNDSILPDLKTDGRAHSIGDD